MDKPKLVVVGNGMAGVRCVEEICRLAPDFYDITIFGGEPRPNYSRIMLSKVLQGDASLRDIVTHDWQWYEEMGIRLFAGSPVIRIDPAGRIVETASGHTAEYDKLVLATGSSAFIPPLPGAGKPGVIGFRSMDDCERMMEAAKSYRRAAVIGGGLLGLEAARGLLNLGMEVTVVHNAPYLMNRQLDQMSADMLRGELERQGMRFLFGARSERILGRRRAEGVAFADGTKLQADLIVMAVGIRPNVELAKSAGVQTNRAFLVNDYLETSVPDIHAVGECAEHDGIVYGLVKPLFEQGEVLAKRLCGLETAPYRGSIPYAKLKISGVDVFSAGDVNDPQSQTAVQFYDGVRGTYRKVLARDGKVVGAILYGDIAESKTLMSLLRNRSDVAALGRASDRKQSDDDGAGEAASIPDAETVCQCNSVSKAAIVQAVAEGGLTTVEQVRDKTRASGSCGGCKALVSAVIKLALAGGGAEKAEEPAICACTKMGHAALKEAVAAGSFAAEREAMEALGWRASDGCSVCKAALRYYIGADEAGFEPHIYISSCSSSSTGGAGIGGGISVVGAELTRRLQGMGLPSRVEAGVASAWMERSGLLVRDLGLAEAPSGWELYAGGFADRPVRQAQLLAVASGEEEVLEMAVACLNMYKETAYYGETVWKWLERIGLYTVRERLLDPDSRAEWLEADSGRGSKMPLPLSLVDAGQAV